MAKKVLIQTDDDGEDLLLSKKAKRKLAKVAKAPAASAKVEQDIPADDTMSRIALLCQENRWREAALLCHQTMAKNEEQGQEEDFVLSAACLKIEKSLRRQMAAAFLQASQKFLSLNKEAGE